MFLNWNLRSCFKIAHGDQDAIQKWIIEHDTSDVPYEGTA